jgi:DNA-binding MarR family transcriptional regulator
VRPIDNEQPAAQESASYRELRLLEEIQRTPEISQRQLARQLGVALGVANALVRGLARRGYIRSTQVGWKQWVYVLTPTGINRKVQLTLEYIENFIDHYKRVRQLLRDDLGSIGVPHNARIAVHGVTELAELIHLSLADLDIHNVDFIGDDTTISSFLGRPVKTLEAINPGKYVKVIVASSVVEARREALANAGFDSDQIVTLLSGVGGENIAEGPGQPNQSR